MKTRPANALYFAVPLLALVIDQAAKDAVRARFEAGGGSVAVIPGFLDLVSSFNPGGAFGLLGGAPAFFLVVSIAFVIAAFAALAFAKLSALTRIGLGLAAGGALGNTADRFRWGEVYDFIDCHIGAYHWPAFNAADAFIVVGAAMIAFSVLRRSSE